MSQFTDQDIVKFLTQGFESLTDGNFEDASAFAERVVESRPKLPQGHFLIGLIAIEKREFEAAQESLKTVVRMDNKNATAWAKLARMFVRMGEINDAYSALAQAIKHGASDPLVQNEIGSVFDMLGEQDKALEWYEKACSTKDIPSFQMNKGTALLFHGRFDEARESFKNVVKQLPNHPNAHWSLSRLDTAKNDQHIEEMRNVLQEYPEESLPAAYLYYAIGKEYEDLEMWSEAFDAFEAGAKARRSNLAFDEEEEVKAFEALKETFTKLWMENVSSGYDDSSPIFIIGQPRTGTTLVERIITARDDVYSAGELQQFRLNVAMMTNVPGEGVFPENVVRRSAHLDLKKLGRAYIESTKTARSDLPYFVDKYPLNYLYAPLIAAALPKAKIIHLTRDPMDSCFSSYKQLFAETYFHSYDQGEMARHHLRYRDLMDHYREVLGGRMIDVAYEDVVHDIETQARRLIDYLGLEWQDASLEFHKSKGAVTTASATQVREKAHTRSVGRWKRYEKQLSPMREIIEKGLD